MIVTLNPNDTLVIRFADCDGEFEVHFDSQQYPKQLVVAETAGLPGNKIGAAGSILYCEDFSRPAVESEDGTVTGLCK